MNRKKRGFTLIEMMIVVVIIAILAGAAIPTYNRMVRKSEATDAIRFSKSIMDANNIFYASKGTYYIGNGKYDGTETTTEEAQLTVNVLNVDADTLAKSEFTYTFAATSNRFWIKAVKTLNSTDRSIIMFIGDEPTDASYNSDLWNGHAFTTEFVNNEDLTGTLQAQLDLFGK